MSRGEDEVQGEGHSRHIHSLTVQSFEESKRLCDPRSRRSLAARSSRECGLHLHMEES